MSSILLCWLIVSTYYSYCCLGRNICILCYCCYHHYCCIYGSQSFCFDVCHTYWCVGESPVICVVCVSSLVPVLVDRLYSIVFLCVILIDDLVDNVHYVSLPSGVRVVVLLCIVVMYHHYLLCRWIIVFCIVGELEDCFYFASLLCVIYIAVLVNGLYYV